MTDELIIQTMADFERILDENPDIRESIRRKLLTDDERELPRIVASLTTQVSRLTQSVTNGFAQATEDRAAIRQRVEQGFTEAAEDRAAIRQEMTKGFTEAAEDRAAIRQEMTKGFTEAAEDRAAIREDIAEIRTSVGRLEDGQKSMGGLLLEQTAARRLLPRITQELRLSRPRVLKSLDRTLPDEVEDAIYDAVDRGDISQDEANAVTVSDFIMSGNASDDRTLTYVLAEVSGALNRYDITRAKARASTLEKATGVHTIPAVAAATIPEPQRQQASAEQVLLYLLDNQW